MRGNSRKRVETCSGDPISEVISSTNVYRWGFTCLNGDRGAVVINFPQDQDAGVYEITINAASRGPKIVDVGNNPAPTDTFSVGRISCSSANAITSAALGVDSSLSGKAVEMPTNPPHASAFLRVYAIVTTFAILLSVVRRTRNYIDNGNATTKSLAPKLNTYGAVL